MSVVVIPEGLRSVCRRYYPDHTIQGLSGEQVTALEIVIALMKRLLSSEDKTPYRRSLFYARFSDYVRASVGSHQVQPDSMMIHALSQWGEGSQWLQLSPALQEFALRRLLPQGWMLRVMLLSSAIQNVYFGLLMMGLCPNDEEHDDEDDALRLTIEKILKYQDHTNNPPQYLDDALADMMLAQDSSASDEEGVTELDTHQQQMHSELTPTIDPFMDLPPGITACRVFVYLHNTTFSQTHLLLSDVFRQHPDVCVRECVALMHGESLSHVQHSFEMMACMFPQLPSHLKAQFLGHVGPGSLLHAAA